MTKDGIWVMVVVVVCRECRPLVGKLRQPKLPRRGTGWWVMHLDDARAMHVNVTCLVHRVYSSTARFRKTGKASWRRSNKYSLALMHFLKQLSISHARTHPLQCTHRDASIPAPRVKLNSSVEADEQTERGRRKVQTCTHRLRHGRL